VNRSVESRADYACAFLEAEGCLLDERLRASGPGPLRWSELLLGANPMTHGQLASALQISLDHRDHGRSLDQQLARNPSV